jgi:ribulose-5-phosphate 4-epimerase/fuculose-1-phosphate aldolase
LVKIDMDCNKLLPTEFPVNPAGFTIHSAIHAVRHDAHCVMHTHTKAGVAVSALESGLLPISQQSTFVVNNVAYHDYEGLALRGDEIPRLQADLGEKKYLILRNHGLLTTGKSAADAFLNMYIFESACQIQIAAQACGPLVMIPSSITDNMAEVMKTATAGQGAGIAWPALIRKLDRTDSSYRT